MRNKKSIVESYINKIKAILLKEENEEEDIFGSDFNDEDGPIENPSFEQNNAALSDMAKLSANKKADTLNSGLKLTANNILTNTLMKGGAFMPSSDFIDDMIGRYDWEGQKAEKMAGNDKAKLQRKETTSPKLNAFDYMLQVLSQVRFADVGSKIQLGGNEIEITDKVKNNAKDGLLSALRLIGDKGLPTVLVKMLEGSFNYTISNTSTLVKPPRNQNNGAVNQEVYTDRLLRLQKLLYSTVLDRMFSKEGQSVASNISASIINKLRQKYIDIVRSDRSATKRAGKGGSDENVIELPDGTKVIDDEYSNPNYSPDSNRLIDDPEFMGDTHMSMDNLKGGHYRKYKGLAHGSDADEPEQDPFDTSSSSEFNPDIDSEISKAFDSASSQQRLDQSAKKILNLAFEYMKNRGVEPYKLELIKAAIDGDSISQVFRNPELGAKYPEILKNFDRDKTAMQAQNATLKMARKEFQKAVEELSSELPAEFLEKVRGVKKNTPIRKRAVTNIEKGGGNIDTSNLIPVEKTMKDGTKRTVYVDPDEYYAMLQEKKNAGMLTDIFLEYLIIELKRLNS